MVEPFCGSAVEAMLCGTPVLTGDYGAFTETNIVGVTGSRAADERGFIESLEWTMGLPRAEVAESAAARFSTQACGPQYAQVFDQVARAMQHSRPLAAR